MLLKYAHNMSIIAYITSFFFWRWNYIYVKLWLFQMIRFKSWHFKSSLDFQSVNAQSIDFLKWNSIQYCKWTLSVSNQIQFNMSMNLKHIKSYIILCYSKYWSNQYTTIEFYSCRNIWNWWQTKLKVLGSKLLLPVNCKSFQITCRQYQWFNSANIYVCIYFSQIQMIGKFNSMWNIA